MTTMRKTPDSMVNPIQENTCLHDSYASRYLGPVGTLTSWVRGGDILLTADKTLQTSNKAYQQDTIGINV